MHTPARWGKLLVEYSEWGEELTPEAVERQIDAIVEGMETGPGPGEEAVWIAAAKEALGTAHVARTNGCEGDWDRIGDAFAAQYRTGAEHCRRAVEAIMGDANAYQARWEIAIRVRNATPHGAARARLTIDACEWSTETQAEDIDDLAGSVAAAMSEKGVGEALKRRLVAEATVATCAGAGEPGALIAGLETVADSAARARAGAWLLAVAATGAGWTQACRESTLEPAVIGHDGEQPAWLAEARAQAAFGRQLFDAARRWSGAIEALGDGWREARAALAEGVINAEPTACIVLGGLAVGDPAVAGAVVEEIRTAGAAQLRRSRCSGHSSRRTADLR